MFDRFRALDQARQIMLIAATAFVIGLFLVAVWFLWLRTDYQPLFTNLRPGDAAVIVAELDRKKIPYRLAEGGTVILVSSDRVDATRLNVMTADLPLRGTVGFELFNKSDMGLTDFAQKINYQRALQGELARTIMTLDDVESARVHLSMGQDRIFRDDRVPPKASVTIRMKNGAHLSPRIAQGIQRLVSAAIPNLEVANVVILDEAGQIVWAAPQITAVTTAAAADTASPLMQEVHAIEQYYAARIREALKLAYPGDGFAVTVAADVTLHAGDESRQAAELAVWDPAARKFPLQVLVSPTVPMDSSAEVNLRNLVATAMGASAAGGDMITVDLAHDVLPPATALPPPDRQAVTASPAAAKPPNFASLFEDASTGLFEASISLGVLIVVLVAFLLVIRRLRRPRRLTDRQRADFAARLHAALEQEDARAAARS